MMLTDGTLKGSEKVKTVKEVATEFKVTEKTVRLWISDGKLKAIQPFKRSSIRIEEEEIERFLKGGK